MAKELDGRLTPASGALAIKGDVSTRDYLVECKTTAKTQYVVKLADLEEHYRQADAEGKAALFVIDLHDEAAGRNTNNTWVLMPMTDFKQLTDKEIA